jgi:hypothetical protein
MKIVTCPLFLEAFFQQMEGLAHSLLETFRKSNSSSLTAIVLLSDPICVEPLGTRPRTTSSLNEASPTIIEDACYKIIRETTTTSVWDTVREMGGPNSSYLVMRPRKSVSTSVEFKPMSGPSLGQNSDNVSKTLVLHNVSITPEMVNVLKDVGLDGIRLKYCTIEHHDLDLCRFSRLERLHISLIAHSRCSIEPPSCLQELIVYVNQFAPTKSNSADYYTHIDAKRCGSLKRM